MENIVYNWIRPLCDYHKILAYVQAFNYVVHKKRLGKQSEQGEQSRSDAKYEEG